MPHTEASIEVDEYEAVRRQCLAWLTRLTGEQGDGLRRLFEGCASLADCLAIIEERGARMRCCPHCDGDKLYTASCVACNATAAASVAAPSMR